MEYNVSRYFNLGTLDCRLCILKLSLGIPLPELNQLATDYFCAMTISYFWFCCSMLCWAKEYMHTTYAVSTIFLVDFSYYAERKCLGVRDERSGLYVWSRWVCVWGSAGFNLYLPSIICAKHLSDQTLFESACSCWWQGSPYSSFCYFWTYSIFEVTSGSLMPFISIFLFDFI